MALFDVTEAEVEALRWCVRRSLRRYWGHADFDDIWQEAWLLSCREWPRLRDRYPMAAITNVCSRCAFANWVRSRKSFNPLGDPRCRRPPQVIYQADLPYAHWEEAIDPQRLVIRRLSDAEAAARALDAMTPRQAAIVRQSVMAGESCGATGRMLGVSKATVAITVQRGLAHARRALEGR